MMTDGLIYRRYRLDIRFSTEFSAEIQNSSDVMASLEQCHTRRIWTVLPSIRKNSRYSFARLGDSVFFCQGFDRFVRWFDSPRLHVG